MMDEQQGMDDGLQAQGMVDTVLRGLAIESVRALVINIDIALAVFGAQLRSMRIDDDLRMCRQVLNRAAGKG